MCGEEGGELHLAVVRTVDLLQVGGRDAGFFLRLAAGRLVGRFLAFQLAAGECPGAVFVFLAGAFQQKDRVAADVQDAGGANCRVLARNAISDGLRLFRVFPSFDLGLDVVADGGF